MGVYGDGEGVGAVNGGTRRPERDFSLSVTRGSISSDRVVRQCVAVCVAFLLVFSPSLDRRAEAGSGHVDLRDGSDVVIVGPDDHSEAGFVSNAGDVNGDKVPDMLLSSCQSPHQLVRAGATFVIFGVAGERREVQLGDATAGYGFRIDGGSFKDWACRAEGVGDVNGDGLDDIAIAAPGADNRNRVESGSVYVIFGKTSTTPVSLATFDMNLPTESGFRIDGPGFMALAGFGLAAGGDMNADGLDDILVGAPWAGSSYLVYGKSSSEPVDLAEFHNGKPTEGVRISHVAPDTANLFAVSSAGDMNGDGIPDIAIGLSPTDNSAGIVYVVYGALSPGLVDTRGLGKRGFTITGARSRDETGLALDAAGDVNADGVDDLIIGAPRHFEREGRGSAYVIFGGPGSRDISLSDLGKRGFRIQGLHATDRTGLSVAGGGDVNNDGLADVLVGAPGAVFAGRGSRDYMDSPGAAFVVFGKPSTETIRLRTLGSLGYTVKGAEAAPEQCEEPIGTPQTGPIIAYSCGGDRAGVSVDAAGDINGDGYDDILVGAWLAGDPQPGHGYLIWSHPFIPH